LSATGTTADSSSRLCGIRFDKIEKRFGSLVALRGVTLDILPGEFVALLGHNGAGKTTLLRIAALLMDPTSGKVSFTGAGAAQSNGDAGSAHNRRLIGMVGHSTLLYDELTAEENLRLFGQLYGLQPLAPRVADALAARAACASAWPSPGRCCTARACCCWTSLPPASTGRESSGLAPRWHVCATKDARC
jgi:ABC-type sugar transport system ATPase subunit